MKKLYQSERYFRYSRRVSRKALKRRLFKAYFFRIQRRGFLGKTGKKIQEIKDFGSYSNHVSAPIDCRLFENTEEVISFINKLELSRSTRRTVFVVLKHVEFLDNGSLAMLLSVMASFKQDRIGFNGDHPKNLAARQMVEESGFFDFIYSGKSGQQVEYIPGRVNQFVTHGEKKVDPRLLIPLMSSVSETIWGMKRVDRGLCSVLMELMQNTNNHASKVTPGEQQWWLSVNQDRDEKRVGFCFVDHGIGILTSLGKKPSRGNWAKWAEKITSQFGAETNDAYMKLLLNGELHATVTGYKYRGKGIPNIKRMMDMNRISNLFVISNNVAGNVSRGEYRLLNNSFQGTLFSWELCESSFNQPWTIHS